MISMFSMFSIIRIEKWITLEYTKIKNDLYMIFIDILLALNL